MATTFPIFVPITALDRFSAPLGRAAGALEGFGRKAERFGRKLTVGLTAPLAAFGAVSISAGLDYQRSLNRVGAITDASAEEMAALQAQAEAALGPDGLPYNARQAAGAMVELAQSGQSVAEIQATLPGVIRLATATLTDEREAAKTTADVLDVYGLAATDSARVTDLLAFAATKGEQDLAGLAAGVTAAGSTARAFEQDLAGTIATLNELADLEQEGAKGAAIYKAALARLARPTGSTLATLRRLGVEGSELLTETGNLRNFDEILGVLTDHGADAGDAVALFGTKAGPTLANLLGEGTARVRAFAAELRGPGADALAIANRQLAGGVREVEAFSAKWEQLLVTVARSGLLEGLGELATIVGGLVTKVSSLSPAVLKWGIALGAVTAAVGPLLVALGGLAQILGVVLPIAAKAFGVSLAAAFGWVGVIAAAIAGLVVAGIAVVRNWDTIKAKGLAAWEALANGVGSVVDWLGAKLAGLADAVPDWLLELLGVGDAVPGAGAALASAAPAGSTVGVARLKAAARGAGGAAGGQVGGRIEVAFDNAPPGTRVRAAQTGDVPIDVETGVNLAGGMAG